MGGGGTEHETTSQTEQVLVLCFPRRAGLVFCGNRYPSSLMAPVLLSRTLDPILGVFTGALAYYLYENNPRSGIQREDRLSELVQWKLAKWKSEREKRLTSPNDTDVLTAIKAEVEKE